jgi:hypothetical protein
MILTVALIIIVAALVLSGTGELRALDEISRAEFAGEAQAYSVAQAGLVDAYAWFRRQPIQPVTSFAPVLDLAVDPPINETEDPAAGLVRTFEISPGLWGRYTVQLETPAETFDDGDGDGIFDDGESFNDTNGNNRRDPAKGTRDVTAERGLPGAGTVWRVECMGQVFRRPRADLALGDGPNYIVGSALLATEIQRLPLSPPVAAAAYCSRGDRLTCHNRARVRAPTTALAYPLSTGTPSVSGDSEISGSSTASPVTGDRLFDVFGANLTDLQSMADISTKDESTLPDTLPPNSLVVVDGDLLFDATESLRGSGILIVTGNLVIEPGSHSYYNGFVYVGGSFSLSAPSYVRGQVMARDKLILEGGIGDFVELEHDQGVITSLLATMGHYRYARAFFRPLPYHTDGRPDQSFETRSGRSVQPTVAESVLVDTFENYADAQPDLAAALATMKTWLDGNPEDPAAKDVRKAFDSALIALDRLLATPPQYAAAASHIANAVRSIEQARDDHGLDPLQAQDMIDALALVPTGD